MIAAQSAIAVDRKIQSSPFANTGKRACKKSDWRRTTPPKPRPLLWLGTWARSTQCPHRIQVNLVPLGPTPYELVTPAFAIPTQAMSEAVMNRKVHVERV